MPTKPTFDFSTLKIPDAVGPAQPEQDSSAWNTAKAALDVTHGAVKWATDEAKQIALSSPPGQAYLEATGRESELSGGAKYAVKLGERADTAVGKKTDTPTKVALAAGGGTLEWMAVGKLAHALKFLNAPVVEAISPMLRRGIAAIHMISEEPADAAVTRILSNATAGAELDAGALEKAATRATRAATGKRVAVGALGGAEIGAGGAVVSRRNATTPSDIITNASLGALFGALDGAYTPATNRAILQSAPKLMADAGLHGESTLSTLNALAGHLSTAENLTGDAAAKMIVKVARGTASESQKIALSNVLAAHPEIVRSPFGMVLARGIRGTSEGVLDARVNALLEADARKQTFQVSGYDNPMPGAQFMPLPSEAEVKDMLTPSSGTSVVDGSFPGPVRAPQLMLPTRQDVARSDLARAARGARTEQEPAGLPLPKTIEMPFMPPQFESFTPAPDAAPIVRGPETLAGTPIVAPEVGGPGTKALLPPLADARTDIPNVAPLVPPKLSAFQRDAWSLAAGSDYGALESRVTTNQNALGGFLNMVTRGTLRPEHVANSDVARTIAGLLEDTATDADTITPQKYAQLYEHANAFLRRSQELRGEKPDLMRVVQFAREPESGDIVRTVGRDAATVDLIDKQGRVATVNRKDAPIVSAPPEAVGADENVMLQQLHSERAELLKRIEAASGANEAPVELGRPTVPGGAPVDAKPVIEYKRRRMQEAAKGLFGYSKGAVERTRGEQLTGPGVPYLAKQLGGTLHKVPEGYVVSLGGREYLHPTLSKAGEFLRGMSTAARIEAEQSQVFEAAADGRGRVPALNLEKVLATANELSRFGNPREYRPLDRVFFMQKKYLLRLDSDLAAGAEQYGQLHDMLVRSMTDRVAKVAYQLDKLTDGEALEKRTAPPEAQHLYDTVIKPLWDENYKNAATYGIPVGERVREEVYFPHTGFIKSEHISDELRQSATKAGITAPLEDVLANPEANIPQPPQGAPPRAFAEYQAKLRWATDVREKLDPYLEKDRLGHAGWDRSVYRATLRKVNADAKRLAQAAIFGPHNERIEAGIQRITKNAAFTSDDSLLAKEVMNDVLGNTARHLGKSSAVRTISNLTRFLVSGSATRHIFQNSMTIARALGHDTARTTLAGLRQLTADAANGGPGFAHAIGAALSLTRWELGEGAEYMSAGGAIEKASELAGSGATLPLHLVLNTTRSLAAHYAAAEFDAIYVKALAGDRQSLGFIQDTLNSKISPEALAKLDKTATRQLYAKSLADQVGTTFRPGDFPKFARTPQGAWFFRFRTFLQTMPDNVIRTLSTPGVNKATRVRMGLAMIAAIPTLGAIDPELRHRMRLLGQTIDSEVAYDAIERWRKDPKNLGKAVYAEITSALNAHMLGFLSDNLMGVNIHNETKERAIAQLSVADASQALTLETAGTRVWYGMQHNNRHEVRAGVSELYGLFGSVGVGAARRATSKKPVRLPKHMVFRKALGAGN